jgi:AcrR family transcriptional regulator
MMADNRDGRAGLEPGHGGASPGQAIWARPERSARGPSPEHSRPEIAAAGVALADASGLAAVTMRSVAAAIGTGAASLYRYVATRDELIELMADLVYSEIGYDEPASGQPAADLLRVARQGRAMYLRHPWLLDIPVTRSLPGPNALAFIEHVLAALAGTGLDGPARLETVGLFSGAVRLAAQSERDQRAAGQDAAQWQAALAGYLLGIAAAGTHPHLAAALADPPGDDGAAAGQMTLFDRIIFRIINGLLPQLPPEGAPDPR